MTIYETLDPGDNNYQGYTIEIAHDDDPIGPRDWDNLGTMYCEHGRYDLGDKNADDIRDMESDNPFKHFKGIILPLYLYDHSGLSMSTDSFIGRAHHADWDSGQVGYIYISDDDIRREYGVKRISKQLRERVAQYLVGEVNAYDQYLTGDVWGFNITDPQGDDIESVWGFYGLEHVSNEACSIIDYDIKCAHEAHLEHVKTMIRNRVPLEQRAQ